MSKKLDIKNHPLLKTAQQDWTGLNDMFSSNNPYERTYEKDMNSLIREASIIVQDVLAQFDVPMLPAIRFMNHRDVKYARNDKTKVTSAILLFDVDFKTITHQRRNGTIPVTVRESEVIPPSVLEMNGRTAIISQTVVDDILERATSYYLPEVREGYALPQDLAEREIAVATRNEIGWRPTNTEYKNYMMRKNDSRKHSQAEEYDGNPLQWGDDPYEEYQEISQEISQESPAETAEPYAPEEDQGLIAIMDLVNIDPNLQAVIQDLWSQSMDDYTFAQALQADPDVLEAAGDGTVDWNRVVEELRINNYITASRRTHMKRKQAGMPMPSGYATVLDSMKTAEKDGVDTFPRAYDHLLRHYILNHVATAYKDQWMVPMINAGYCLNPYGTNVRVKSASSWEDLERQKRAQEMEKEMEMEVDGPVEEVCDAKHYPGTKTPMEISDGVKFQGPGGGMSGTIVELDEEGDYLIIKNKGHEYRINKEDIEPLPSTFKKMYM